MNNNLGQAHDDLMIAWRALQQQWHALREEWRDDRARRFERDAWPSFEQAMPQLIQEINALNQLIKQAGRDVK